MVKNRLGKLIRVIIMLTLILHSAIGLINIPPNISNASTMLPPRFCYNIAGIDDARYPGLRTRIQALQSQHPNWTFRLLYTGIDWNEAVIRTTSRAWGDSYIFV